MGNGYVIMINGDNGRWLIWELEICIKEVFDIGYEEFIYKMILEMFVKIIVEYFGIYCVIMFVEVDIVLSLVFEGFWLIVLFYIDNEMYWYEGDGCFFVLDGSIIYFVCNEDG